MINVLVVDDNPIVRQALTAVPGMDERSPWSARPEGRDALAAVRRLRPTVVLHRPSHADRERLSVITAIASTRRSWS